MVICTALSSYFKYPPILFVRHAWWLFPSTKNHAQRIPAVLSFHLPNQGNAQTTQTVVRNKSASPWPARQVRLLRGAVGDLAWVAVCKQVVTTNLVFFPEGHPALPWPLERVKKKKTTRVHLYFLYFSFFLRNAWRPCLFFFCSKLPSPVPSNCDVTGVLEQAAALRRFRLQGCHLRRLPIRFLIFQPRRFMRNTRECFHVFFIFIFQRVVRVFHFAL